jgi:hypothetical protein
MVSFWPYPQILDISDKCCKVQIHGSVRDEEKSFIALAPGAVLTIFSWL